VQAAAVTKCRHKRSWHKRVSLWSRGICSSVRAASVFRYVGQRAETVFASALLASSATSKSQPFPALTATTRRNSFGNRYLHSSNRLISRLLDEPFITLKVHFLFLALSINLLLVVHHHRLESEYSPIMHQVEVCIIVATVPRFLSFDVPGIHPDTGRSLWCNLASRIRPVGILVGAAAAPHDYVFELRRRISSTFCGT